MKTAIYIQDGDVQLVITPENEFEINALKSFDTDEVIEANVFSGTFYACAGGWVRQSNNSEERSIIFRATTQQIDGKITDPKK